MTFIVTDHGRAHRVEQNVTLDIDVAEQSGVLRDSFLGGQVVISQEHYQLQTGDTFLVSYKSPDDANIADDGTVNLHIATGAKQVHLSAWASCGGDMEAELLEGTTIDGDTGTEMTVYNKRRASATASLSTVKRDITVDSAGTLLEHRFIPGGDGGNAVGGARGEQDEWIVAANTNYMLRITNRAGTAQPMSIEIEWYEEN